MSTSKDASRGSVWLTVGQDASREVRWQTQQAQYIHHPDVPVVISDRHNPRGMVPVWWPWVCPCRFLFSAVMPARGKAERYVRDAGDHATKQLY